MPPRNRLHIVLYSPVAGSGCLLLATSRGREEPEKDLLLLHFEMEMS